MDRHIIAENYNRILSRMTESANKAGRKPEDVRLLVVTKGQPVERMEWAYDAGARLFGENYPDETAEKVDSLRRLTGLELHMIGHLQSRKARIVAGAFDCMHSIDRVSIAEKLDRELLAAKRSMPVLLEVNVSGEDSKQGFTAADRSTWNELFPAVEQIAALPSLSIRGLMTMPPLSVDPEMTRPYFARLRELQSFLSGQFKTIDWSELSMGTSSDFESAILEGATFIRVGSAIMGPRPPKKLAE